MNYALIDLKAMITDIVNAIGADKVAEGMANWNEVDKSDIPGMVVNYFKNDVEDYDFEDLLDTVYAEFYNIAADNDYTITTFDQN